jgi:hypothetical protein
MTTGYCLSCRERRTILDPRAAETKTGRRAIRGRCEVCGSQVFRLGHFGERGAGSLVRASLIAGTAAGLVAIIVGLWRLLRRRRDA